MKQAKPLVVDSVLFLFTYVSSGGDVLNSHPLESVRPVLAGILEDRVVTLLHVQSLTSLLPVGVSPAPALGHSLSLRESGSS